MDQLGPGPSVSKYLRGDGTWRDLAADDHTQYALLAGRAGGQTLIGGTAASQNLTLQSTSNATRGYVLSPDPLGIGIAPQTGSHVYKASGAGAATEVSRLTGSYNGTGSGPLLRFTNTHGSGTTPNAGEYNLAGIAGLDGASSWGGALAFYTSPDGTSGGANLVERMRISQSGYVGIGKAPVAGEPLNIASNQATSSTNLRVEGYYSNGAIDNETSSIRQMFNTDAGYGTYWKVFRGAGGAQASHKMLLGTRWAWADNNILVLSADGTSQFTGNVGIGGSPVTQLTLMSPGEAGARFLGNGLTGATHGLFVGYNSGAKAVGAEAAAPLLPAALALGAFDAADTGTRARADSARTLSCGRA